jgi:hypothetical protein
MARPAVAAKLLELDVIGVLAALLRQASPTEWVATAGVARLGLYPIVTSQYIPTTLYQVSDRIQ